MHNEAQVILQHLFNRSSLNEISVDELSSMAEQYPYMNALQFLLAKKRSEDIGHLPNGSHPSLFFSNPLWFEFLMNQEFKLPEAVDEDEQVMDKAVSHREDEELSGEKKSSAFSDSPAGNMDKTESVQLGEGSIETMQSSNFPGSPETVAGTSSNENGQSLTGPVQPRPILPKGTEEGPALEFEPFHTIDYFASQGIKLQQADLSRDKFGQQLKSFTEWLKSMKRIPPVTQPAPAEVEAQDNVVKIAEHSNESREVYTEAMAEVWAKQGNRLKATEIYQKLSLLNPGKSAYFAAKIEQLNS